jgi:hypothetical protein
MCEFAVAPLVITRGAAVTASQLASGTQELARTGSLPAVETKAWRVLTKLATCKPHLKGYGKSVLFSWK